MTKSTALTVALLGALAMPAFAGGVADPVMEPDIIMEQMNEPSSGTGMLPFILFALLVAAATSN